MNKLILAGNATQAASWLSEQPIKSGVQWITGSSPQSVEGVIVDEVYIVGTFFNRPDWHETLRVTLRSARKQTLGVDWFVSKSPVHQAYFQGLVNGVDMERDDQARKNQNNTSPTESNERDEDAARADELACAAMNPGSSLYRDHGPDRLLAAAQVYATLSTRPQEV